MNLVPTAVARTAASTLAGTGLVAAAVVGVQHAGSTGSSAAPVADKTSHHPVRCHRTALHVGKAPAALEQDLKAARQKLRDSDATGPEKRTQRREALATIRQAAKDGRYGDQVQQRLEKRQARIAKHRAALPEKLRADLAALQKTQPGAERREAATKIREGRLDGTYGDQVQQRAEKAKAKRTERRQTCQDRRQERRQTKHSSQG